MFISVNKLLIIVKTLPLNPLAGVETKLFFWVFSVGLFFIVCVCFLVFWVVDVSWFSGKPRKPSNTKKTSKSTTTSLFCGFAWFLGFLGCPGCLGGLGFLGGFGFLSFAWCAQPNPNFRNVPLHSYPASCGRGDNCTCGRE